MITAARYRTKPARPAALKRGQPEVFAGLTCSRCGRPAAILVHRVARGRTLDRGAGGECLACARWPAAVDAVTPPPSAERKRGTA